MIVAAEEAPVASLASVAALLYAQTLQDQSISAESVESRPRLRRLVGLGRCSVRHSQHLNGRLLLTRV